MEASENEPADTGDLIMVDFSGTVDGQPFEGSQTEKCPDNWHARILPGLVNNCRGQGRPEVKIALPDDFRVAEVAGQENSVVVNDIHKKRLANLMTVC